MTQVDKSTFRTETTVRYADNSTGDISANDLRIQMDNIADSAPFIATGKSTSPGLTDDGINTSGNGAFEIGDLWIDESNDQAYICLDNAAANAVWGVTTFDSDTSVNSTGGPAPNEIPTFQSANVIQSSNGLLTWDGATLDITGDIDVSGTVAGRDMVADGVKLDGIPADAINAFTASTEDVGGGASGFAASTLVVETGDGLVVTNPSANEWRLRLDNSRTVADTVDRTLDANDNGAFITNLGAAGAVTWTVPQSGSLAAGNPRLVATFFKSAAQTMSIVGQTAVTINGVVENGGNETLTEIGDQPYNSVAYLIYAGTTNTYYLFESTNITYEGPTNVNEIAFWATDARLTGDANFLWDGSQLTVNGKMTDLLSFNEQGGTTYTLALTDQNELIPMDNAGANTVTIPAEASVALPVGTVLWVMQKGAGVTTVAADVGVTLNGIVGGSGAITAQWKETKLYKAAADTWYATGDIGVVS